MVNVDQKRKDMAISKKQSPQIKYTCIDGPLQDSIYQPSLRARGDLGQRATLTFTLYGQTGYYEYFGNMGMKLKWISED